MEQMHFFIFYFFYFFLQYFLSYSDHIQLINQNSPDLIIL